MRLTITGFRGLTTSIDLPRRTLVTGPHDAGKSSIGWALQFLFLGYVPALGKEGTVDVMAPGKPASVILEGWPAEGHMVGRKIAFTAKGGVQTGVMGKLNGNAVTSEVVQAWLSTHGPHPWALDFGAFKALRGADRRKAVCTLVRAPEEGLNAYVYEAALAKAMELDALTPDAGFGDVFITSMSNNIGGSSLESIRVQRNHANSAHNAMAGAVNTLAKAASPDDLALVERLPELADAANRLRMTITQARNENQAATLAKQRHDNLRVMLDQERSRLATLEASAGKLESARAARKAAQDTLDALRSTDATVAQAESLRLSKEHAEAQRELSALATEGQSLKAKLKVLETATPDCKCPQCGHQYWSADSPSQDELLTALRALQAEYLTAKESDARLATASEAANKRMAELVAQAQTNAASRRSAETALATAQADYTRAQDATAALDALRSSITRLEGQLPTEVPAVVETDLATLQMQLDEAETRVRRAQEARGTHSAISNGAGLAEAARLASHWDAVLDVATTASRGYYQAQADAWSKRMAATFAALAVPFQAVTVDMTPATPRFFVTMRTGEVVSMESLSMSGYIRLMLAMLAEVATRPTDFMLAEVAELNGDALVDMMRWASEADLPATMVLATCHDVDGPMPAEWSVHHMEARV